VFPLDPVVDLLRREVPVPLEPAHDHTPLVRKPVAPVLEYPLELDHKGSVALPLTRIKN
jgi:hypothetical protein